MTTFAYRPVTKESQLHRTRIKPTQKQMGDISTKVRKRVNERSNNCCERCMKHKSAVWTLEQAHITSRVRISHKTTEYDLVRLCGPSTQSGTCHHWVESTRIGKDWLEAFRLKLLE